jgi:excisionase family DNA binding protein
VTGLEYELVRALIAALRSDAQLLAELHALLASLDVARPSSQPARKWLTVSEAAELLGCSTDAIRMRCSRGRLEHRRQGRRLYVSAASVDQLG